MRSIVTADDKAVAPVDRESGKIKCLEWRRGAEFRCFLMPQRYSQLGVAAFTGQSQPTRMQRENAIRKLKIFHRPRACGLTLTHFMLVEPLTNRDRANEVSPTSEAENQPRSPSQLARGSALSRFIELTMP